MLHDWQAIEGEIEITLLSEPDTTQSFGNHIYQVSTKILSAKLKYVSSDSENDTHLTNVPIDSVTVGWLPG